MNKIFFQKTLNIKNMKKLILSTFLLTLFFSATNAQFDVDKLFGGANLAFAKPVGEFSDYAKGGFSYNIMVGYQLTEKLGVGVEYGSAVTGAIDTTLETGFFGLNAYGLQSFLAKGWYRFTTGTVRPYVGLGIGGAQIAEPDITVTDSSGQEVTVDGASRVGFGANLELGLNIKGFNMSYSYNVGGKGPKEPVFNPNIKDLNLSYHRFALGYVYNF